nr:unnamed protein product [Callosobruchus chinensis]
MQEFSRQKTCPVIRQKRNCVLFSEYKQKAKEDLSSLCGVFDLQQVIYLPISNETDIFYKSRNKGMLLFWNETVSKRGSSEIATCISHVLEYYSTKGIKSFYLYADGCAGQNKNSVIAAMLLHSLSQFPSIDEISLRFFETHHGQSEGDAARSATNRAITTAGNLFVPSQLYPIMRLARRKQPYIVILMSYNDFKDFKMLSKDMRILSFRSSEKGSNINWTNVMEVMVKQSSPYTLLELSQLNIEVLKISKKKYKDLMSLCQGTNPVVRLKEYQQFFLSLPHFEEG